MSTLDRFKDEYGAVLAGLRGWPVAASPRFSTSLVGVDSGDEQANRRWQHPLYRYTLPEAVRTQAVFEAVRNHWLTMAGPFHTWPFRDPLDFASLPLPAPNEAPTITGSDQVIGTGDGAKTDFALIKSYVSGAEQYDRPIILPVVASVLVTVNGVDPTTLSPPITWSVSRPGGIVSFSSPITAGQVVRAGYLYDVLVRYESDDSFDGIARTFTVSGFADLVLIGVRPC